MAKARHRVGASLGHNLGQSLISGLLQGLGLDGPYSPTRWNEILSIEIRWPVGSHDDCVTPWGVVEYGCPRPDLGEVGHLMLAVRPLVKDLLSNGPQRRRGALHSATFAGDYIFAHIEYRGYRWVWELFDAHFADSHELVYLGRWPD